MSGSEEQPRTRNEHSRTHVNCTAHVWIRGGLLQLEEQYLGAQQGHHEVATTQCTTCGARNTRESSRVVDAA